MITLAAGVKPTAVSAAAFDAMAIGSDGNLYAWGSNTATINGTLETFGELGDGTANTHDSPEVITLATGVAPVAVSAGLFDTLAIGAPCSDAATTSPVCHATPTPTPSDTSTPSTTPTPITTPTPTDTTRSHATATADTSAVPSTPGAAPTHTPPGAAAAVQATSNFPVGAPATGGGTGAGISGTMTAAGVAVMAAGTGLVVLARRRRHRRPPV